MKKDMIKNLWGLNFVLFHSIVKSAPQNGPGKSFTTQYFVVKK